MRWLISLLLIATVADAAHIVTTSGRQINGEKITAAADGSVTLITAGGQSMTFQKGQYRAARADRPRELEVAKKLFAEGKNENAVAMLKKVKRDYRFLAWDQSAMELLADHYFETENYAAAAAEYRLLEAPSAEAKARLRNAVLRSSDADSVLVMLNEEIKSGDRSAAAKAYLARGDLKAAAGDIEGARRDWLKVVLFFKAQKEEAAEAEEKLGAGNAE